MLKVAVLVVAAFGVAAAFIFPGTGHGHDYDCNGAGIFTDPADNCRGYHVCGYNIFTMSYEHLYYVQCPFNKLFNGRICVPPSWYNCTT